MVNMAESFFDLLNVNHDKISIVGELANIVESNQAQWFDDYGRTVPLTDKEIKNRVLRHLQSHFDICDSACPDDVKGDYWAHFGDPSNIFMRVAKPEAKTKKLPPKNKHTSELLEILNHAIADNWEDYKKPPTNDMLNAWFDENYPNNENLSNNIKKSMCTIMRPIKYKKSLKKK